MSRIYVASSWRNTYRPIVVARLEALGHEVYDFKHPPAYPTSAMTFHWKEVDPNWQQWDAAQYRAALASPVAQASFKADMDALRACEACLLVLPCGRSAHLELGWAAGAGKKTAVLLMDERTIGRHALPPADFCDDCNREVCALADVPAVVPELMHLMLDKVIVSLDELDAWAGSLRPMCPYAGTRFSAVPGYEPGYGCPRCKGLARHLHVDVEAPATPRLQNHMRGARRSPSRVLAEALAAVGLSVDHCNDYTTGDRDMPLRGMTCKGPWGSVDVVRFRNEIFSEPDATGVTLAGWRQGRHRNITCRAGAGWSARVALAVKAVVDADQGTPTEGR